MARTKTTKKKCTQPQDKPFACHCGTRFIKRIYLNAHIKKFHLDKTEDGINNQNVDSENRSSKVMDCEESSISSVMNFELEEEDWSDPDIELLEPVFNNKENNLDSNFDVQEQDKNEDQEKERSVESFGKTEKYGAERKVIMMPEGENKRVKVTNVKREGKIKEMTLMKLSQMK